MSDVLTAKDPRVASAREALAQLEEAAGIEAPTRPPDPPAKRLPKPNMRKRRRLIVRASRRANR